MRGEPWPVKLNRVISFRAMDSHGFAKKHCAGSSTLKSYIRRIAVPFYHRSPASDRHFPIIDRQIIFSTVISYIAADESRDITEAQASVSTQAETNLNGRTNLPSREFSPLCKKNMLLKGRKKNCKIVEVEFSHASPRVALQNAPNGDIETTPLSNCRDLTD